MGMSDAQKWMEEVLKSNNTLILFLLFCMYIFYDRQKAVLTIVGFELVDTFIFQISIVSTFPFAVNFFVLKIG